MPPTEGLYVVEFGDVATPGTYGNCGVAVLVNSRVFGGDGGRYYVGNYSVDGEGIVANARIVKHNPDWEDAWGDTAESFTVTLQGRMSQGVIVGSMERTDIPGVTLPVRLTWKEDIP
jgi:hypothetical protein